MRSRGEGQPASDPRPSAEFQRLGCLGARELEAALLRGDTPDPDALAG
jgi:hypothetical protein